VPKHYLGKLKIGSEDLLSGGMSNPVKDGESMAVEETELSLN
jgi:hypothetical protein